MEVKIQRELIDGILTYSKDMYPNEIIFLLRGRVKNDIVINEVIMPPFAVRGRNFSGFNPYNLSFDPSIVGLVHSHPSGTLDPSIHDLNHFYGSIMMIAAYPFHSIGDIAIFNREGKVLPFEIVS